METTGEPFIEVDGERVDRRDIEALTGIAEFGSMHRAAGELGRSYSRIQQRISELEDTLGPLVSRTRGGEGGGGSRLTDTATQLLGRFDRLRAEFSGLARTAESVFDGTVVDRDGRLGTIETAAGLVKGIVPTDADRVQVSIRSDTVGLMTPDQAPRPTGTSVRNQFRGRVTAVESEAGLTTVTVDVGAEVPLRALLTETSLRTLDLSIGDPVVASFKATATRAVPKPDIG